MTKEVTLRKLNSSFFHNNMNLIEALHCGPNGDISLGKIRGYGVLTIHLDSGLVFGIPLRSHISHKDSFITHGTKGLDYSKAVLLNSNDISSDSYEIDGIDYHKIREKSEYIRERFKKYVKQYIKGLTNNDQNILKKYRFSTLQNYHSDLQKPDPEG